MPALRDLDRAECERLLRGSNFGRVVLVTPERPEIVPVNYVVHAGAIVIRTSPTGILARHAEGAELVFEVDRVDDEYWSGWSVVARGPGQVVTDPPAALVTGRESGRGRTATGAVRSGSTGQPCPGDR